MCKYISIYIYITVVSGQTGGRTFQNWTAYSPYSGTKNVPIGCGQAFCTWQQQSLDLSFLCHRFSRLDLFSFHVISSHQLFLEIAYCIPLSPQSVLSHCISAPFISSCLKSSLFSIGSGPRSSFQLLSTDSSHLTSEQSCADPFSFNLFLTIFCGPSTLFPSSLPNSPLVLPYISGPGILWQQLHVRKLNKP